MQTYTVCHWILLTMRNASDKSCRENQHTHFLFNNLFPPTPPPTRKYCCLWRDVQKYATARQVEDGNKIRLMSFACWMANATGTHSEYVTLLSHGKNGCMDTPQRYFHRYISCLVKLYSHLCLGLPNVLRPSHFPTKDLYTFLFFPTHASCPVHLNLLHFITLPQWREQTMNLLITQLFPNSCYVILIRPSIQFSSDLSKFSSVNDKDQVPHPWQVTVKTQCCVFQCRCFQIAKQFLGRKVTCTPDLWSALNFFLRPILIFRTSLHLLSERHYQC